MALNRIELLNHSFSRVLRGYDPGEVEHVLQEAADAIGHLNDERVRLTNHINQLEAHLAEYTRRETAVRESLVATQRMGETLKTAAQKEGQLIIDAAQKEGQLIIEAARAKAENITNQAALRLARILDEIADARRLKAQFEFKVRSVIESHLKLLEFGQIEDARMERATAALAGKAPAGDEEAGE